MTAHKPKFRHLICEYFGHWFSKGKIYIAGDVEIGTMENCKICGLEKESLLCDPLIGADIYMHSITNAKIISNKKPFDEDWIKIGSVYYETSKQTFPMINKK